MELIKYPEGSEPEKDGLHLPGVSGQDAETLCGVFMDGANSYPTDVDGEKPQCKHCIGIARELFKKYTKKQVRTWSTK